MFTNHNSSPNSVKSSTTTIDFKETINAYLRRWPWFVFFMLLFVVLGFLYLRYNTPEYTSTASVKILGDESTELGIFKDLNLGQSEDSDLETEILSLKSRSNMLEVVDKLKLNVRIFAVGKIKDYEIYKSFPFQFNFQAADSIVKNFRGTFFIKILSNSHYGFGLNEDAKLQPVTFGNSVSTTIGNLILVPNTLNLSNYKGKLFRIEFYPLHTIAQNYRNKILISPAVKGAKILDISLSDPVEQKSKDVIDKMIEVYLTNAVSEKKAIADKTSQFIDDRISSIYEDLSSVDQNAQEFKTNRGLTDMVSESSLNLNYSAATEQELNNASIQLNIASGMKEIIDDASGYDILPSNLGLDDVSIATTTARYNDLVLQRKKLLESSNDKNPVIVNIDQQLNSLKSNMKSSLKGMTDNLMVKVNSLSNQASKFNYKLYSAPKNERKFRDITRKQETTEALYLYLLQKREEAQVSFASSEPKVKVVDWAYSLGSIGAKRIVVYMAAIFLGLFFPSSFFYVSDLLDTKIHSKLDLENIVTNIPVIAELPKIGKKESKLFKKDDRSVLAESLRILRTNLDYLLNSFDKKGKAPIVFVTSSVSGEGKTFISSNLAMTISNYDKKVLLIGADIRNPKINSFFSGNNVDEFKDSKSKNKGLTEYISDINLTYKEITKSLLAHTNSIDVIYSGKIPPNPSELLISNRIGNLFNEVSKVYDYVIVDTAPMFLVTDTLLITKYADQILYVTKAGVTEKKIIDYPKSLLEEGKIKNLSFIVNNVSSAKLGYGGKYGYGYGQAVKKWWEFWS